MSQSFKDNQLPLHQNQLISKGNLLDSLDLNTGYDAIEKAKLRNEKLDKVTKGPIDYKPKVEAKFNELSRKEDEDDRDQKDNSSSDLERDDNDDMDWLRQSMQASMKNWAQEVDKINQIWKKNIMVDKKIEECKSKNMGKIDNSLDNIAIFKNLSV